MADSQFLRFSHCSIDIPFNADQVRVLLFRECDFQGRKLLFDSSAIQKTVATETPTPSTNIATDGKPMANGRCGHSSGIPPAATSTGHSKPNTLPQGVGVGKKKYTVSGNCPGIFVQNQLNNNHSALSPVRSSAERPQRLGRDGVGNRGNELPGDLLESALAEETLPDPLFADISLASRSIREALQWIRIATHQHDPVGEPLRWDWQ